ncbi:MAG TPA: outer membrane beta-barrel protein [Longimicrobiales bacterium]
MRSTLAVLASVLVLASPAAAQDRAVTLFARAGGYNALTDLNDAGDADLKAVGYTVGGGAAVRLHRYVSVRGDLSFGRNELQVDGAETGDELSRLAYTAAVQVQYPTASGFEPYAFAGAGGITLHEVGTDENETKPAGTFGIGFAYSIPRTPLALFIEGQGWVYKLDGLDGALADYDKVQVESGWSGGISYRLPF